MKEYVVKEIFFSLQGEGIRAGTATLFLRFADCNQACCQQSHGFDCDTDFLDGIRLTLPEIIDRLRHESSHCQWLLLTGGEPALQVDRELIDGLHAAGFKLAIETNGTVELPPGIDWITVSPKVAESDLRQRHANEVKYVRSYGQPIPETIVTADHKLISPAFNQNHLDAKTLDWCIQLVRENPEWRLSVQQHKFWGIR